MWWRLSPVKDFIHSRFCHICLAIIIIMGRSKSIKSHTATKTSLLLSSIRLHPASWLPNCAHWARKDCTARWARWLWMSHPGTDAEVPVFISHPPASRTLLVLLRSGSCSLASEWDSFLLRSHCLDASREVTGGAWQCPCSQCVAWLQLCA